MSTKPGPVGQCGVEAGSLGVGERTRGRRILRRMDTRVSPNRRAYLASGAMTAMHSLQDSNYA